MPNSDRDVATHIATFIHDVQTEAARDRHDARPVTTDPDGIDWPWYCEDGDAYLAYVADLARIEREHPESAP